MRDRNAPPRRAERRELPPAKRLAQEPFIAQNSANYDESNDFTGFSSVTTRIRSLQSIIITENVKLFQKEKCSYIKGIKTLNSVNEQDVLLSPEPRVSVTDHDQVSARSSFEPRENLPRLPPSSRS